MSTYKHPRRQFIPLIVAFAAIALLFGMWTQYNTHDKSKPIELENGTIIPVPHDISNFNLVGLDNKPFTNQNLKGKWTMIFFGFTNCPMLCPTTLTTLNKMYEKLDQDHVATMPQVLFISLDPDRDTPKAIAKYLKSFNKHFVGATGKQEMLDKMTKEMNVVYEFAKKPHDKKDSKDYTVNHSGTIILVNPEGKLFAIFSSPQDAAQLSNDIKAIEKHYS